MSKLKIHADPTEESLRAALLVAIDDERSEWYLWQAKVEAKRRAQEALLKFLADKPLSKK